MRSRLPLLKDFARKLQPYWDGIFSDCRWPLGTNLIEDINNTTRVIKRMAYGFWDGLYFFLKIPAAFLGNR
jgi:transposase